MVPSATQVTAKPGQWVERNTGSKSKGRKFNS